MHTDLNRRQILKFAGAGAGIAAASGPWSQSSAQALSYIGQFKFISIHGRLLQAHTSGEMHASQEVDKVGEEERWNIYLSSTFNILLENCRTNRWLSGEPNGKAICDRASPGPWERWVLFASGDGVHVSLRSAHGLWLVAQPPGQDTEWHGEVAADRHEVGPWESFLMVPSEHDKPPPSGWWSTVKQVVETARQISPIILSLTGG